MNVFSTKIFHPATFELISADVEYEMGDIGVMMEHNEDVQPIILSVRYGAEELIRKIDEETRWELEDEAKRDDGYRWEIREEDKNEIDF